MNAHDSERISGLLEADGMERVETNDEADVVVLNTCCIRENADNKLYGTLGHLRKWKAAKEGRRIVIGGCLSQKDKDVVAEKAPWVDVVMGTHNVHRTTELLNHSIEHGPITEILDEAVLDDYTLFPSALPVRRETTYNAWVTIQIGCDNSCAYCIVPAVRGREISRPFADVIGEVAQLASTGVTAVTLLGQNVNSYGRDITLAERQAGSDGRVQPLPCTVRDYVFENFDVQQEDKIFAGSNAAFGEVFWFYTSEDNSIASGGTAENDRYVVFNYEQQVWYYGTMDRTCWVDRGVDALPIAASSDHYL